MATDPFYERAAAGNGGSVPGGRRSFAELAVAEDHQGWMSRSRVFLTPIAAPSIMGLARRPRRPVTHRTPGRAALSPAHPAGYPAAAPHQPGPPPPTAIPTTRADLCRSTSHGYH
jgi:hypothetical protein